MKGNSARQLAGYVLAASAVVACPCHLALTLPLLLALGGGTALGAVLTQPPGLVFGAATLYFLAAVAGAYTLLSSQSDAQGARDQASRERCCPPVPQGAQRTDD
jgi:mercuric ion transport protein